MPIHAKADIKSIEGFIVDLKTFQNSVTNDTVDIHTFAINLKDDKWNDATFLEFMAKMQKMTKIIEAVDHQGITNTMIPILKTHVKNLKDVQNVAGSDN